jgi:ABC-2 type transport system ATP-binding protein
VGLLGATDQRIQTFSTGMCTRLGIAASLIADPPLLLWDEPTAGLDPAARRFTLDLIRQLGKTRTVLVATHILSDIDQICDHVGVMHEGRMIFSGSMLDMKRRLRRDDFCLVFDGDGDKLSELAARSDRLDGVQVRVGNGPTMIVRVDEGRSRADALAEILKQVDSAGLSLESIQSGQNETENAYLQLLQEDEAHGFQRFELEVPGADDAVLGDPPA